MSEGRRGWDKCPVCDAWLEGNSSICRYCDGKEEDTQKEETQTWSNPPVVHSEIRKINLGDATSRYLKTRYKFWRC